MPVMAKKIHEAIQPIGYEGGAIPWTEMGMAKELDQLEAGQPIHPCDVLFAKIMDEQIAEWKTRFSGAPEG
jgi:methionyl-tRNA synthetase